MEWCSLDLVLRPILTILSYHKLRNSYWRCVYLHPHVRTCMRLQHVLWKHYFGCIRTSTCIYLRTRMRLQHVYGGIILGVYIHAVVSYMYTYIHMYILTYTYETTACVWKHYFGCIRTSTCIYLRTRIRLQHVYGSIILGVYVHPHVYTYVHV